MDHCFKGLILALSLSASSAFAGYAQASPPAGWSAGGGSGGSFTGTAANNATFRAGSVATNASMNVGGRSVSLPASMRFAANAPRYAAAAVMMHPTVRGFATVAGWLGLAGLVYDAASGLWTIPDPNAVPSTGTDFFMPGAQTGYSSAEIACTSHTSTPSLGYEHLSAPYFNPHNGKCYVFESRIGGGFGYNVELGTPSPRPSVCPVGTFSTPAGCTVTPPPKTVTEEEAIEEIIKHPMPADVPQHIPVPLPVETPSIEPTFIPTSDPVPNPAFDPSVAPSPSNPPSTQPGVEVKPAPTPLSPWQVSVTPVNRPVEDPTATPGRDPVPLPSPSGSGTGTPPTENKPQDTPGLCDQYPTIIACQVLEHEPDDTKLPEKEIDFEFNPIPGFQGTKSCPAFPNVGNMLGGKQISWQPFCDTLAKISNLLLAFAWASAAFIILGYGRGD